MTDDDSDSALMASNPPGTEVPGAGPRSKKSKSTKTTTEGGEGEKRQRKKTFKDLTPEQQDYVRQKRRERKKAELEAHESADDEDQDTSDKRKTTHKKRKTGSEDAGDDQLRTTNKKKRKKRRTAQVAGELEQVDLDERPNTDMVKASTGRSRQPGEEEDALANLEDDDDLMASPFSLPAAVELPADLDDDDDAELSSSEQEIDEQPLDQGDSQSGRDAKPRGRARKSTGSLRSVSSKRTGRMKGNLNPEEEEKKAHPMFIATIVGIPAILVVIMGWYKFGSSEGQQSGGVDRPNIERKVERTGSKVEWEKAQDKALDARDQYQNTMKKAIAAEDDDGQIKDKDPIIAGYQKAMGMIDESLSYCEKMLEAYKKEQRRKDPKISEQALERKLKNSKYGAKREDWKNIKKDIVYRLRLLRGHKGSSGGSRGD